LLLPGQLGPALKVSAQTARDDRDAGVPDPRLEWSGPESEMHRKLAGPLRAVRQAGADGSALLAQLAAPGVDAIAPLFDILVQERVPHVDPQDAPQILSTAQRELLLAALAKLPREPLRAALERRLPKPPAVADARMRIAMLRVLSVIGTSADLSRLAGLAPREQDGLTPVAASALRSAYAGILRREPAILATGLRLLKGCDDDAASEFLSALGELREKRALPLLEDCMRTQPQLAQQAIGLVAILGPSDDTDYDRRVALWLAEHLDPERSEWTRASVRALGALDDGHQVPALLAQLESDHPGVREVALAALRRVSGLQLHDSAETWREWYAGECAWLESRQPDAERELGSEHDAEVARALDECAAHRIFRDERAPAVLGVLESGSPAMRVLSCATLARLGSRRALPALVERISDDDPALAQAAWRAACELSGRELARDSSQAREQLADG
jgi:HEAT repeat protein